MYFEIRELVKFCAKHKITIEQYAFCYLLYVGPGESKKYASLYKYSEEVQKGFSVEMRMELVDRKIIVDHNKHSQSDPDNYELTDRFKKHMKQPMLADLAETIFDAYPTDMYFADGRKIKIRNMGHEEVEKVLKEKRQRGRLGEEDEVKILKILREEKDTVQMGLSKWLQTEQWNVEIVKEVGYGKNL